MDFSFANSGFGVQNDGTYLPKIMRETCISIKKINKNSWSRTYYKKSSTWPIIKSSFFD